MPLAVARLSRVTSALSTETKQDSDIEWSKIIGMRNILVHNYFSIDTDIVWAVIENNLPSLRSKILEITQTDSK